MISTGTRGRIAIWDLELLPVEKEVLPLGHLSVHQSGINGLDCRWVTPDELLILTGGDDNALICTRVRINRQLKIMVTIDNVKVLPHAAQISGKFIKTLNRTIHILPFFRTGVALFNSHAVSVSLDQRLILWKLDGTDFKWLNAACCDVADIQGLDVRSSDDVINICVYGQGIQIFHLSKL